MIKFDGQTNDHTTSKSQKNFANWTIQHFQSFDWTVFGQLIITGFALRYK